MKEKRIEKKKLPALIGILREKYQVFAPLKQRGNIAFSAVSEADKVELKYSNSNMPPKSLFLPQTEKLLSQEEGRWKEEKPSDEKRVIFGLRPCDVKSLALLDKVFSGEDFADPYYLERRTNSFIVTLACDNPQLTCFCTSFNGAPFSEEGADIVLFELEDGYLLSSLTSKGEELVRDISHLLGNAKESDLAEREKRKQAATKKINSKVRLDKLDEKLSANFDHSCWNEIYEKCLSCAACTYLCPTCHCFDITDEVSTRTRCWDCCQFPLFTLHASGHNPRPSGKERMRQRVMHKFSYCPQNFGETFCVGCGRCARFCPVNLDIRSVTNQLSERLGK